MRRRVAVRRHATATCVHMYEATSSSCWSSVYSCPPHNYSLSRLIGEEPGQAPFDLFTVATPLFMRTQFPGLYQEFFEVARILGSSAFLVTKRVADCDAAARLGIACAVSNVETRRGCEGQRAPAGQCGSERSADVMMSQEKWVVIAHFLSRGRRIMFAGADARLLRPTRALFRAVRAVRADVCFDSPADQHSIPKFTPDIFAFLPTRRALAFVGRVRAAIHALTDPLIKEAVGDLVGPAEQDLLHDVLLSTVYRFPLAVRTRWRAKVLFGKYGYAEATERLIERHGSRWAASHPASPSVPWHSRDDVDRLTARREERVRKGLRQQFGPLNATLRADGGSVVTSRDLSILFGADSVFAGPELTCQKLCSTQRRRRPFAVHCGGKQTACLMLTNTCQVRLACDAISRASK